MVITKETVALVCVHLIVYVADVLLVDGFLLFLIGHTCYPVSDGLVVHRRRSFHIVGVNHTVYLVLEIAQNLIHILHKACVLTRVRALEYHVCLDVHRGSRDSLPCFGVCLFLLIVMDIRP